YYSEGFDRREESDTLNATALTSLRTSPHNQTEPKKANEKCDGQFAEDELNLLAKLLCKTKEGNSNSNDNEEERGGGFRLNLFSKLDKKTPNKR
ncbi:Hypothetical protein FKW44_015170, partial [Caligus rogercresseyi]